MKCKSDFAMPNITFTCPNCGRHQLMRIEQAIHRCLLRFSADDKGSVSAQHLGRTDELHGEVLGYRCQHCRYPDNRNVNDGPDFLWTTLEDVQADGALELSDQPPPEPHHCMICHPDGRLEPLVVETKRHGKLTQAQRRTILAARNAPQGCILLCEQDKGIKSFSPQDWPAALHVRV